MVQNQRGRYRWTKAEMANTEMRKWMEGDRAAEVPSEGDMDTGTQTFRKLETLPDKDWRDSEQKCGWE